MNQTKSVSCTWCIGGWHRWQPGDTWLWGVLLLLQDDVNPQGPVPPHAHLQQSQRPPQHRWPGPATWRLSKRYTVCVHFSYSVSLIDAPQLSLFVFLVKTINLHYPRCNSTTGCLVWEVGRCVVPALKRCSLGWITHHWKQYEVVWWDMMGNVLLLMFISTALFLQLTVNLDQRPSGPVKAISHQSNGKLFWHSLLNSVQRTVCQICWILFTPLWCWLQVQNPFGQ